MKLTRLADRDNLRQVEKEWQYEFMAYVLSSLKVPEDELAECLPESADEFDTYKKRQLRSVLEKYFITIVDDRDGGLKFYLEIQEGEEKDYVLVAEWKKCKFNYREDPKEVAPAKKMYVEVIADVWAVFDELDEEE